MASYRNYKQTHNAEKKASDARLDADRMEAKVQRLLRTCENIVLAANLPKVTTPEIVARYEAACKARRGHAARREVISA